MIQLHRTGDRSRYWAGDSFAIRLNRMACGRWRISATSYETRCRDWLRRNPDVEGMTFDRLSEARAYLNAVCSLDPLPEHPGADRYRLRLLGPGHYKVLHPGAGARVVVLRRNANDGMWEFWLQDDQGNDAVQMGGRYQSLWHAQGNLDHVFRNGLPSAAILAHRDKLAN